MNPIIKKLAELDLKVETIRAHVTFENGMTTDIEMPVVDDPQKYLNAVILDHFNEAQFVNQGKKILSTFGTPVDIKEFYLPKGFKKGENVIDACLVTGTSNLVLVLLKYSYVKRMLIATVHNMVTTQPNSVKYLNAERWTNPEQFADVFKKFLLETSVVKV